MIIIIIFNDKNDNDDNNKCQSIYSEFSSQAEGGGSGGGLLQPRPANYGDNRPGADSGSLLGDGGGPANFAQFRQSW